LTLLGVIYPEATFPTYRAGTLNLKPELVRRLGWRWQVDVLVTTGNIGSAIIGERKEVDRLGALEVGRRHRVG